MLSQTLDSLQTQIDTVFVSDRSIQILQQIIENQNTYYSNLIIIILAAFSLLLSVSVYFNYIKIKSELSEKLNQEINTMSNKLNIENKKIISATITNENTNLKRDMNRIARESYKSIGLININSNDHLASLTWFIEALNFSIEMEADLSTKEILGYLVEGFEVTLKKHSKKEIYKNICSAHKFDFYKEVIGKLKLVFNSEKGKVLDYINQIELGKEDNTKPFSSK